MCELKVKQSSREFGDLFTVLPPLRLFKIPPFDPPGWVFLVLRKENDSVNSVNMLWHTTSMMVDVDDTWKPDVVSSGIRNTLTTQ